jgi:hypothetical protein
MNKKQLGNLLRDDADPLAADALTESLLRRDRRRIAVLAVLCVVAWMAVVMLPWATTLPMLAKVVEHQNELYGTAATTRNDGGTRAAAARLIPLEVASTTAPADTRRETTEVLQIVKQATILTFVNSLISMFVAACFTVALIVVSRRATLRQVNARLAEISAHVRALAKT